MSVDEQVWADRYWHSAEGLRLHFRDYDGRPDRPPIFCLHGLTRNARDFEDLAARLAGEWRVVVPDFRGRGLSAYDPVPERYAPPTYAVDIVGLMDLLEVDRAVFIGTSLGGLVTMAIAAADPSRVAGAVLNDIGPELEQEGLKRIRGYVGKPKTFASWEVAAEHLAATNANVHPGYTAAEWLRMAKRLCVQDLGQIRLDYDMAVAVNVLSAADAPPPDAWPLFRALDGVPLLLLRGELSDLLSDRTARQMVEMHPGAELVTVPGVGHAPDLTDPDALAGLGRLLRRIQV